MARLGKRLDELADPFVAFANYPAFFKSDYRRYLQNRLREELPFSEVPVRIIFRMRN